MQDRALHLGVLKEQLLRVQNRMKLAADLHRSEVEFQVGDKVLLKLQPYAQSSLVNRPYPKLAMKYFGPYIILDRIGSTAYKLDLPPSSLIHPTFQVSQLKAFVPDHNPEFSVLPHQAQLDAADIVPEAMLDRCLVKKGNHAVPQVLIKWTNVLAASATWEDFYMIQARFPSAMAWGQASSLAGEAVMPQHSASE